MMAPIIKTTYGTTPRTGHRSGQATPAPSPLPFYCGGGRHRLRWFLPQPLSASRTAKAAARHKRSARHTTGPALRHSSSSSSSSSSSNTKPEPAAAANKTTTTTKISSSNTNYNHHHSHHHHHHHQQQQQQYEIKLFEASDLVIYKRQIV